MKTIFLLKSTLLNSEKAAIKCLREIQDKYRVYFDTNELKKKMRWSDIKNIMKDVEASILFTKGEEIEKKDYDKLKKELNSFYIEKKELQRKKDIEYAKKRKKTYSDEPKMVNSDYSNDDNLIKSRADYADTENFTFPISTKKEVENSIKTLSKSRNISRLPKENIGRIISRTVRAAKKHDIDISPKFKKKHRL